LVKITVDNVQFSYRSDPVLKDVTFDVDDGAVLGLVGPNGSGKTTLIRCIDRILNPEGSVFLDGRSIRDMRRNEIALNIGYVPQTGAKIAAASVFEVVMMGRTPHMGWRAAEEDLTIAEKAMRFLGVEKLADLDYNELSGGQQQKVLIARAVAQDPKVLLLDEPTNSLDIRHQLEALSIIHKLSRDTGITVIMAVHDLTIAARFADRLMMLKNGRLVAHGTPDELITPTMIREVYGVESKIFRDEEAGLIVTPIRAIPEVTA
jgi:iron complex transport system ATP-binding protein